MWLSFSVITALSFIASIKLVVDLDGVLLVEWDGRVLRSS